MSANNDFSSILETGVVTENELKDLIEKKKRSLGYLINDDVAIRLVARDLGLRTSNETQFKMEVGIEDLVPMMRNVNLSVNVERVLSVKEFTKKDGNIGKVGRVLVKDATGVATLVLWDNKTEFLRNLKPGDQILIRSGYTKTGLNRILEIHIGEKGEIQILKAVTESLTVHKGRVWKVFDPIEFVKRDGNKGRMVSFLLKENHESLRVVVWNPTDALLKRLIEGVYVEITQGIVRKNQYGGIELHINNEKYIITNPEDIISPDSEKNRLSEIKPAMKNLTVEGTIEGNLFFGETYDGKKFARVMLKEDNTILPIVFWDDKALFVKEVAKPGARLQVNGCYSKIGPNGLEIVVNRWGKVKVN